MHIYLNIWEIWDIDAWKHNQWQIVLRCLPTDTLSNFDKTTEWTQTTKIIHSALVNKSSQCSPSLPVKHKLAKLLAHHKIGYNEIFLYQRERPELTSWWMGLCPFANAVCALYFVTDKLWNQFCFAVALYLAAVSLGCCQIRDTRSSRELHNLLTGRPRNNSGDKGLWEQQFNTKHIQSSFIWLGHVFHLPSPIPGRGHQARSAEGLCHCCP